DKLRDTVGRLPPCQSRTGTGGASSGTAVVAPLNTTYWGLLKQPDNQKMTSNRVLQTMRVLLLGPQSRLPRHRSEQAKKLRTMQPPTFVGSEEIVFMPCLSANSV